jgi:hypothetical protein
MFWKDIEDVTITAACDLLVGGRNHLTPRFVRHFGVLFIPSPDEMTLKYIFKVCIVNTFRPSRVEILCGLSHRLSGRSSTTPQSS